jgi:hypothetical protein
MKLGAVQSLVQLLEAAAATTDLDEVKRPVITIWLDGPASPEWHVRE